MTRGPGHQRPSSRDRQRGPPCSSQSTRGTRAHWAPLADSTGGAASSEWESMPRYPKPPWTSRNRAQSSSAARTRGGECRPATPGAAKEKFGRFLCVEEFGLGRLDRLEPVLHSRRGSAAARAAVGRRGLARAQRRAGAQVACGQSSVCLAAAARGASSAPASKVGLALHKARQHGSTAARVPRQRCSRS